jgi:hypothetical protein
MRVEQGAPVRPVHLLLDVVGDRLPSLHHRRLLPAPGGLEGGSLDDRRLGGRPERGRLDPETCNVRRAGVSHGRGLAR